MRREALKAAYERLADAEDLRKAGQPERALRITSALVEQFPTYWAALHTHGLVLSETGDLAGALKFLLLADSVWPNQSMTIAALAQTQLNCGLVEQALDCTERGLAIAPDQLELLYTRAEILRGIARYAKAEPLYRRIMEVHGPHLKATIGLANCLLELGRARNAGELLENAATRWPSAFEPVYELSSFPKAFLSCEPRALLARWAAGTCEGVDPASLAFAQAWALHNDGRHAEAWQHLKRANQLVFDVEQNAAHRDLDGKRLELRRLEDAGSGIDWHAASHREDCPRVLFILGPSRSGKTTLESLLESCGLIRGDESNLIATTVRDTLQGAGFVPFEAAEALPKNVRETFVARYCAKARELAAPNECLTITNPEIIADVPYLIGLIPNIRFMLVDRDTNDLIFSIYQQHYARGNLHAYSLPTANSYVGWYRSMAALLRARTPHLAAACSYEDLIERPRDVMASAGRLLERDLEVRTDFRISHDGRNCSAPYRDRIRADLEAMEEKI